MEYIVIIIGSIFVSNIVLAQFLGICPFVGVSGKLSTSIGMGGAVLFVLTLATMVTWIIQYYVLNPFGLGFMQTIVFILVIASLVQMVEIILKKVSPSLYSALGVFLPLITTNCAVLGVAILTIQKDFNLVEGVVYAISNAIGFTLAMVLFAGIREHMDMMEIPKDMKGVPIALVVAGILALAFFGFTGLVVVFKFTDTLVLPKLSQKTVASTSAAQ
jgi:electron transport complex protein RnfA